MGPCSAAQAGGSAWPWIDFTILFNTKVSLPARQHSWTRAIMALHMHNNSVVAGAERSIIVAFIIALHLTAFLIIGRNIGPRTRDETVAAVTFLRLLTPPPHAAAPAVDPPSPPLAAPATVASLPLPDVPVARQASRVLRAGLAAAKPRTTACPSRGAPDGVEPNPADCDPAIRLEPGPGADPPLQLPGGLRQDEFGNLVPDRAGPVATLPPVAPDKLEQDAEKFHAGAVRLFGPPYTPARMPWADDPVHHLERGPLMQFLRDRLNSAPLTPQSTLSAPSPTYDIPDWFPTTTIQMSK
jgi:hypothetical protein